MKPLHKLFYIDSCYVSGQPLTILPTLGPEFKVSFELYIDTFKNVSSWITEIFRLTTKKICYDYDGTDIGNRFPAVFAVDSGDIRVSTQKPKYWIAPGYPNFPKFPVQKWTSIEISQFKVELSTHVL